jgi:hypothetical protein
MENSANRLMIIIFICLSLIALLINFNQSSNDKYYLVNGKKTIAKVIKPVTTITLLDRQKQFVSNNVGKCVDFDSHYGCQCVDIINLYLLNVFGKYPRIENVNAYDMGKNPNLIIPNGLAYNYINYSAEAVKYGDIIFWTLDRPVNGQITNHVAIYTEPSNILSQNNIGDLKNGSIGEIVPVYPGATKIVRIL